MSDRRCFTYLFQGSRLLTKCIEWIPTLRRFWDGSRQLPFRGADVVLESYRRVGEIVYVRSVEYSPTGIPFLGRMIFRYTRSKRAYFSVSDANGEDDWTPLPEPIEGLYLVPKSTDEGYYIDLPLRASWPVLRWHIDNKQISPHDIMRRFLDRELLDRVKILQDEYHIPARKSLIEDFTIKWYCRDDAKVKNLIYFLERQPDDVWEILSEAHENFIRPIFKYRDVQPNTATALYELYREQIDKKEVLQKYLIYPEPKELRTETLREQLQIMGSRSGGITKAAR